MMKRWTTLALAAALLTAPAVLADSHTAELDEVLANYYEAMGGLEALQALGTVRMTGKMTMQGGAMEAPFTMTFRRPSQARLEFTFQGMTGIQAYDGETAWFVMPFMGKTEPEAMPADQAKVMKEQADFDGPLIDYADKNIQLELVGREKIEGTDAYNIKVTMDNGDVRNYFLDGEYYLPIKVTATTTLQGQQVESETTMGDYKEVGGVMMAHSISSRPKGAPENAGQTISIETAEVGVEIEDGYFSLPAPAEAAAEGG